MGQYRSGPTSAEPKGLGQTPVVLPEWIFKNVSHNNRLSAVHGGAARSCLRSNAKAVNGVVVGLRKTGSSAVPHVLAVVIQEQDRAQQSGKSGFNNAHQLLQCFR